MEYDVFIAKLPTTLDAAILLPDWNKALAGAEADPIFWRLLWERWRPSCICLHQKRLDCRNRGTGGAARRHSRPHARIEAELAVFLESINTDPDIIEERPRFS